MSAKPAPHTPDVMEATRGTASQLMTYLTEMERYTKGLGRTVQQLKARVTEIEKRVSAR